ncbi:MAG: hypothetical protein ACRYGF_00165 [Janthinobacterium lividum]
MKLGNLKTNWTLVYASTGHTKRVELDALSASSISTAATQYFMKHKGSVYTSTGQNADVLIACDRDLLSIKPQNAKYKAFKRAEAHPLGWAMEAANGELTLHDPVKDSGLTAINGGLTYDAVGESGGKTVYARLDKIAISALHAGGHLSAVQLATYEKSMKKGVIPSGGTGADGIKFDNNAWVVKITIAIAAANEMDNTLSPSATPVVDALKNAIFLNFNQLVSRH